MTQQSPVIAVEVLRSRFHAANGGVSERSDRLDVYPPGTTAEQCSTDPARAIVFDRNPIGDPIMVPLVQPTGMCGPMASGAYVTTSDSRWSDYLARYAGRRIYAAIPLHDRFETWAQYEALSR